jgi:hypothetical protein
VINLPDHHRRAVWARSTASTRPGHYTLERVAASDALKLPGAAAFLLNKSI